MKDLPSETEVVIVGGGVIGLSLAYHLVKFGCRDVLLLERNQLTSGTSWHAAGIIGPLRASLNLTRLSLYATELFGALEAETGQATGYRQTGGLWLAGTEDRLIELKRIAAMGEMNGLEARIVTPEEVAQRAPLVRADDLAGALWVAEDGQLNPVDLCMAYAKGARTGGATIVENTAVAAIETDRGAVRAVVTEDGQRIACRAVANCAGVWSPAVGALAGVAVPVQAVEHMYVVTEPMADLPQPFPILRDLEGRIYIKEDTGKLVMGGFESNAKPWDAEGPDGRSPYLIFPDDWEQFEPFMEAALHRAPALQQAGIQHFMNGPEGFTPDTKQVVGEAPECRNFFVAAGMNSIGMVSSAGAGKTLAQWIIEGEAPMDLWEVDLARFDADYASQAFLHARVKEAVANQFAMHWPYKQMESGRNLKRSPLHQALAAKGAVFGNPAGWERPLWFAARPEEAEIRYSYGAQTWWPMAACEAEALARGVALFELTPFGKFEITGPRAEAFLDRLFANHLPAQDGQMVYGQMLNQKGGIEADVTITRLAENHFWLVSGAATRLKDLTTLTRALGDGEAVSIADRTTDTAVIGVMGPQSRDLLQTLTATDLSNAAFGFATSQDLVIGGVPVRAGRMSFVGELGWELTVANEQAVALHQALCEAGAAFGLAHAGHHCLDSCRMEKAFRHWSHDIGPEDTPLEAGLGFAVAFDKPGGFVGRDALLRQRQGGLAQRLLYFRVESDTALMLHDEPVYRSGKLVGRTTSGGRGFRTGLNLCLATVAVEPGQSLAEARAGPYEVSVAGERYPLTALARPAYDPDGRRLRA